MCITKVGLMLRNMTGLKNLDCMRKYRLGFQD